jgi:predicted nicotinamide N-methyase
MTAPLESMDDDIAISSNDDHHCADDVDVDDAAMMVTGMHRGAYLRMLRDWERHDEEERQAALEVDIETTANDTIRLSSGNVVLQYEQYLTHQRYYDDLKHIDCRYIDYGSFNVTTTNTTSTDDNSCRLMLMMEQDKSLGKGGLCWDAAFVLGDYLSRHFDLHVKSRRTDALTRVLELGCGTGVAGLIMARTISYLHVCLTDLPLCMPLVRRNVARNIPLESIVWCESNSDKQAASDLLQCPHEQTLLREYILPLMDAQSWNEDLSCFPNSAAASGTTVSSFVLDWSNVGIHHEGQYDVVVGADVVASLYDPIALTDTIRRVCHDQSVVFICFRNRLATIQEEFEQAMACYFTLQIVKPESRNRNPEVHLLIAKLIAKE